MRECPEPRCGGPFPCPEHDARLIAAAPELLAALEGLVDAMSGGRILDRDERVARASAAIAKARGDK